MRVVAFILCLIGSETVFSSPFDSGARVLLMKADNLGVMIFDNSDRWQRSPGTLAKAKRGKGSNRRLLYRCGVTFRKTYFLGDIHPRGNAGERYSARDLPVRSGAFNGRNLGWTPDLGVGLQWERSYAFLYSTATYFTVRVSDKGSIHESTGDRLLTSVMRIQSADVNLAWGYHVGKGIYTEASLGFGRGHSRPSVFGTDGMLEKFTNLGLLRPVAVDYCFLRVSAGLAYSPQLYGNRKYYLQPYMFGVRVNAAWRAHDGIDGYYYIAKTDRLMGRGGKDSYMQFGVFMIYNVNAGSEYYAWKGNMVKKRKRKNRRKCPKVNKERHHSYLTYPV